jgi:hypothetical protein
VALPVSYPVGSGKSFPGAKVSKSIKLTNHLHLMRRPAMYGACTAVLPTHGATSQKTAIFFVMFIHPLEAMKCKGNELHILPYYPWGVEPLVSTGQKDGWAAKPFWMWW